MRILTCSQMREVEAAAVRGGSTYLKLMENAGEAAFKCICQYEGSVKGKRCVVFCGNGNNGGDGFVIARKMLLAGADVCAVLAVGDPRSEEAYEMCEIFARNQGEILRTTGDLSPLNMRILDCDIIVDAIYGTGFHGVLPEKLNLLIQMASLSKAKLYSVDIPSGMEGDTGFVAGKCFEAKVTIALEALKPAQLVEHEKDYLGTVELVSIGIGDEAYDGVDCRTFYIDEFMAYSSLKKRSRFAHKGNFGKVLCVCGSLGMTGAAILSSSSALRSGAGVVYVASPISAIRPISSQLVEQIMMPMPETAQGFLSGDAVPYLLKAVAGMTACLVGCGMRCTAETAQAVRELIREAECPLIIDADGINVIAQSIDMLGTQKAEIILTPHPGEMARLIGKPVDYINANRAEVASEFAVRHGVVLVLKGANTIVAAPNGEVFVNSTGNPGLAKAGSGDLLAGMIASFVGQGIRPVRAAISGVYLHGLAADYTMERLSQYSMSASDVLDDYHIVFKECDR